MDTGSVLTRLRSIDDGTYLNGTSDPHVIEILEAEQGKATPVVSTLAELDGTAIGNDDFSK